MDANEEIEAAAKLASAEVMIRRAIDVQGVINHGLEREMTPDAIGLLANATIVILHQAIGVLRS